MTQGAHLSYLDALRELAEISRKQIATLMPHMGERGRIVEDVFRSLMSKILPSRFSLGTGVIINARGEASTQQDVVVYDRQFNAPLLSEHAAAIFPIECVYATIEVKSTLSTSNLVKALESIGGLRRLGNERHYIHTWGSIERNGGHVTVPIIRIETISPRSYIFAFGSDLSPATLESSFRGEMPKAGAHLHGALVLDPGFFIHARPHTKPVEFVVVTENPFAAFVRSLLGGLSSFKVGEMNFYEYLRPEGEATAATELRPEKAMSYEYIIYRPGSTERHALKFDSVSPLPHLQVGHCLQLDGQDYSHQTGHNLVITDIEVYISAPTDAPKRILTHVYTREQDRAELLKKLR